MYYNVIKELICNLGTRLYQAGALKISGADLPASFYACVKRPPGKIQVPEVNTRFIKETLVGVVTLFLRGLPDGGTAAGGREERVSRCTEICVCLACQ